MTGRKHDQGKRDWSLAPLSLFAPIVDVMAFGAAKYERDNWRAFPPAEARQRYSAAIVRHISAWQDGEERDPESGLPHLAHAACSCVFLLWYASERRRIAEQVVAPARVEGSGLVELADEVPHRGD